MEAALYKLIDEHKVKLSFSNNLIPKDKQVTLAAENQQVGEVLKALLAGTSVGFESIGSQIVLVEKPLLNNTKSKFTVSGYVQEKQTGERVVGAAIYEPDRRIGTYTNEYGFFSLSLAEGNVKLKISSLSFEPDSQAFYLGANKRMLVELLPAYLSEVVVDASPDSVLLESSSLSAINLNVKNVSRLPGLGGETDVLRIAYSLPGIQAGADGFGGVAVRGGNVDQNLFLLDGVPVYNATHGVGVFSIYNSSAVRSAQLMKGNFPAQYGGRISSVWDVQTKEGNADHMEGELDIGLSSGKLTLEGPIVKGKSSFFLSGRRAFFDFYSIPITTRIRRDINVDGYIGYYFYDFNGKINARISPKDRIYLSYYRGLDNFTDVYEQTKGYGDTLVFLTDDERVNWGNDISAFRWNHQFSDKVFANTTLTFSRYFYESKDFIDLESVLNNQRLRRDVLLLKYDSNVNDISLKTDFDYRYSNKHNLRFGTSATRHRFQPGLVFFDRATSIDSILIDTLGEWDKTPLQSYEFDAYLQDEIRFSDNIHANVGVRASALTVQEKSYFYAQPRLILHYYLDNTTTLHASASRITQFLHLLSPASIGLPKDLWVSSTALVPPQLSWQFLVGIDRKLPWGMELSLEGYYKIMKNQLVFTGSFLENVNSENWQNMVSTGKGWAYGTELLLKKQGNRFGGWLSYALAWTERQFNKEINNGNKFPFRLDRRHTLHLQTLYYLNEKWEFSLGYTYASGTAFTFPAQEYDLIQPPGSAPTNIQERPRFIDQLNGDRMPAYHKLDLSANYSFAIGKARHMLKLGLYNAYNRRNPLYITLRDRFTEEGVIKREVVQVSLFPIFPALRYILSFK
jgi:hypothetical protein